MIGDAKYTQLKGTGGNLHEVRLNGRHRVNFELDKTGKQVRIHDVGGHT